MNIFHRFLAYEISHISRQFSKLLREALTRSKEVPLCSKTLFPLTSAP
jgi:hypothetical protein